MTTTSNKESKEPEMLCINCMHGESVHMPTADRICAKFCDCRGFDDGLKPSMSKDNFCFIDEVFEQYRLGDATLKHQKAIEQAKQELRQGFKAAMLEEKEARIKQNKSFCGCPMCEHHSEPYEAQETLVNSKGDT